MKLRIPRSAAQRGSLLPSSVQPGSCTRLRSISTVRSSQLEQQQQIAVCRSCGHGPARRRQLSTSSQLHYQASRSSLRSSQGAQPAEDNAPSFGQILKATRQLVGAVKGRDRTPASERASVDPFRLVAKEMQFMAKNLQAMLGSGHPSLDAVAKYYASAEGKHFRPLLVLLMSRATAEAEKRQPKFDYVSDELTNTGFSASSVLNDFNPTFGSAGQPEESAVPGADGILPSQRRLAEIIELIHTASLLHDDVIDHATSRRSNLSANLAFGNKMTILGGDFLLGRASIMLARLRNPEVIELIATIIANLVEGEFMQLKNTALDSKHPVWSEDALTYYLDKTYLKTASLISKSCRAAAVLNSGASEVVEAAYAYGKNLGLAFQLIDDMLDYTVGEEELGKPAGADLELGLATAPLLFAWKTESELGDLVGRKFSQEGDVQRARDLVRKTNGIEQTRTLAQEYADKAVASLQILPESDAKDALVQMASKVMSRRK